MVVLMELPSGILADMIGRRRIFLISIIFMISSYILMMVSNHIILLAAACMLQGIGRAFSSGSIEALEIDSYIEQNGSSGLQKINSAMAVIESTGLALGAVLGGILGHIDSSYGLLLAAAIGLQIFSLIMTLFFVKEAVRKENSMAPFLQLKEQIRQMGGTLRHNPRVTTIVLMSVAAGIILCTVEIYWQPSLKAFLPGQMGWIFGIISCLGYFGVSIGSKIAAIALNGKISRAWDKKKWKLYWLLRFLLILSVAALGMSGSMWAFLLLFILVYAFLGAGNLIENTVFHTMVGNGQRAGMMSLLSLAVRGGGLVTSVLGSLIAASLPLYAVWLLIPLAAAVFIGAVMVFFYRSCSAESAASDSMEAS